MFINTQMLTKPQLAKIQALFIFFACENFREDPTSEKFVKLLDEVREYLGCIDNTSKEMIPFIKEGFDEIQHAAVQCSICDWNDFPIDGIQSMAAMASCEFMPDISLRLFLEQKKRNFGMNSFQLSLIAFFKSLKEIYAWFEKHGLKIEGKFNLEVVEEFVSGENDDN